MKLVPSFFVLFLCLMCYSLGAQVISTDNGEEELFAYKVKNIDEFMERFNDDLSSFIRREYARQNRPFTLSRKQLIVSLFNRENKSWAADSTLPEFFDTVLNADLPKFLFFSDSNWYAEANCTFICKKKSVKIPVILHVNSEPGKGTKWMIVGVGKSPVIKDTGRVSLNYKTPYVVNAKYISSPSHAIDFVELTNVFTTSMNANYYFDSSVLAQNHVAHFIQLILQGKLAFQYVSNIKYHFYSIPGRIIDVEYFKRDNFNSGWLINGLPKVTQEQKLISLANLLNN